MKVIICGGRDFSNEEWFNQEMDRIHFETPITLVIEGGQRRRRRGEPTAGADYFASTWASSRGILHVREDADWNNINSPGAVVKYRNERPYNSAAGPERNQRMIEIYSPDAVIAFPGGSGTANMMFLARKAGIKVIEVHP